MLAGLGVELGLVADRAAGALQEQVGAFTAGEFGLGAEVTCHLYFLLSHLPRPVAAGAGGSQPPAVGLG
jgi:hypothetical protein